MTNATILSELFEEALFKAREEDQAAWLASHPDGKTNPSITDFGRCPRQVWYSLKNVPESNPPGVDSLANFFFGHETEEAVAKLLTKTGAEIVREVRVELGDTSGRTDFLVFHPQLRCLVELKTTKQKQVSFLPQEGHEKQLNGYLEAGQQGLLEPFGIKPEDCNSGVLAYVVKDAVRGRRVIWTFDIHWDHKRAMDDLEVNGQILDFSLRSDLPPRRPDGYNPKKFPCSYCGHRDTCWL